MTETAQEQDTVNVVTEMVELPAVVVNLATEMANRPLNYSGERVVTYEMIDQMHGEGTAKRTFSEHREQFTEGKDFFDVPYVEWSQWVNDGTNGVPSNRGGYRGNRPVFTRSGYALLIKPMKDQLAWDIYKHILQVYFQVTEQVPVVVDADGMIDVAGQVQRVINSCLGLDRKLDVNTAALARCIGDAASNVIVANKNIQLVPQRVVDLATPIIQSAVTNAVGALVPGIVANAMVDVQTRWDNTPNRFWHGKELAVRLVDPRQIPQEDDVIRGWLNNAVQLIHQWWHKPNQPCPTQDIWITCHSLMSQQYKWNVKYHHDIYLGRTGNKIYLDMLCALGRDIQLAEVIFDNFGQQQRFYLTPHCMEYRTEDFTAIGRKSGVTYPWQERGYSQPVGRRRGRQTAEGAAREEVATANSEKAKYDAKKKALVAELQTPEVPADMTATALAARVAEQEQSPVVVNAVKHQERLLALTPGVGVVIPPTPEPWPAAQQQ